MERPVKHRLRQVPQDGIGLESFGAQVAEPPDAVLEGELVHRGPRNLEPRKLEGLVDLGDRLGAKVEDEDAANGHNWHPPVASLDPDVAAEQLRMMDVQGEGVLDRRRQGRSGYRRTARDVREGDRIFRLQAGDGARYGRPVEPPADGRRQIAGTHKGRRSLVWSGWPSAST